jgi:ABC-2 type transport system permease protein
MFIAWFFTVIFILMSGLFTPIESMPNWAQQVTLFNPSAILWKSFDGNA